MNKYGENARYFQCCNQTETRFSLVPGSQGCSSRRHEYSDIDSDVKRLMARKHFIVEQFLKPGEKDPIIEAMAQKSSSNLRVDYLKDASEEEKEYFQPTR